MGKNLNTYVFPCLSTVLTDFYASNPLYCICHDCWSCTSKLACGTLMIHGWYRYAPSCLSIHAEFWPLQKTHFLLFFDQLATLLLGWYKHSVAARKQICVPCPYPQCLDIFPCWFPKKKSPWSVIHIQVLTATSSFLSRWYQQPASNSILIFFYTHVTTSLTISHL